MNPRLFSNAARCCAAGLLLTLVGGCGALRQATASPPTFYALDSVQPVVAAPASSPALPRPTLIVNRPHAAAGFDSERIIYLRAPHQLEYFAHSQWIDTPARMLAPLIVGTLARSASFGAVVPAPSIAAGDLRLDTDIIRLQQDFSSQPSRVRFTLRVYLVDNSTRQMLAWREFDASVAAESEDSHGGVVAANRAVQTVLEQLAGFCTETARDWKQAVAPVAATRPPQVMK
jgi:cholesterol transport system auxiliary component